MSFELKPMGFNNQRAPTLGSLLTGGPSALAATMPKLEEVVWTCGRSPPPVLLAGRVPDDVWASTFDAVKARCAEEMEVAHKQLSGMSMSLNPCCACCNMFSTLKHMDSAMQGAVDQQQAWLKLVQEEQQKYAPYGVQVSLAQEPRITHHGHGAGVGHTSTHIVTVGLKFDKFDMAAAASPAMPMGVVPTVVAAAVVSPPIQAEVVRDGDSVADQLAKLTNLHKTGAITDLEFAKAKAKVLTR